MVPALLVVAYLRGFAEKEGKGARCKGFRIQSFVKKVCRRGEGPVPARKVAGVSLPWKLTE